MSEPSARSTTPEETRGTALRGDDAARESSASISQAGEERVVRIESLRALAAIGVVWAHAYVGTGGDFFGSFGERLLAGVGFGAFFFFSLSGCLLYMPFARRDFGDGASIRLNRYGLNRAVRILPLYYLALTVVLLGLFGGATLDHWWRFALFLQNFSDQTAGRINGVLWTTVVEVHFYITLPLIAYLIARVSRASTERALWILGGMALLSVAAQVVAVLIPYREFPDPVAFSYPTIFYFFAVGMAVPLLREKWRRGRPSWLRGALASRDVWLIASIPFWLVFVWSYRLEPLFAIACFLVLGACLLPLDRGRLMRVLDWRALGLLGLTSYSLYIWHVPVGRFIATREVPIVDPAIRLLEDATGSTFVAFLVVVLPLACAVAAVSYVLIESPPLRLRRRWGGLRRQSTEAPTEGPSDGRPASGPVAASPVEAGGARVEGEPG